MARLHLRASAWYEREGFIDEAVGHALAAPDYQQACDLVERHVLAMLPLQEWVLTHRWLMALPEALIRSRPILCVARAWRTRLVSVEAMEDAERWMQEAERASAASPDGPHEPPHPYSTVRDFAAAHAAGLRAQNAPHRGEPPRKTLELALQAVEAAHESDTYLRGLAAALLGQAYLRVDDEDAAEGAFDLAWQMGRVTDGHLLAFDVASRRASDARSRGRLSDASAICRDTLRSLFEPSERSGRRLPAAGPVYVDLGGVLLEWNDLQEAELALIRGIELCELAAAPEDQLDGYRHLARIRCAQGDFPGGLAIMDRAEQVVQVWKDWLHGCPECITASRAQVCLRRAEAEHDSRWLDLSLSQMGHKTANRLGCP